MDSVSHFCTTPTLHTPTASLFDFRLGTAEDKVVWECGGFCVSLCVCVFVFFSPHHYRLLNKLKFYMKRCWSTYLKFWTYIWEWDLLCISKEYNKIQCLEAMSRQIWARNRMENFSGESS